MTKLTLKPLGLLVLPFVCIASLKAQTVADPVGVVKVTIAAAPAAGQSKLTAISATLRGAIDYQGTATSIGTFATTSQPLNTGVTTWTATQWTAEPHLCYIENAAGAEEAYLITATDESTGVLTLATSYDFSARYTATPTYRICKAHTLAGIFSNLTVSGVAGTFDSSDRVYVWDGSEWKTYFYNGNWKLTTDIFGNADNTVIFPDEGLFISRSQTTDIIVTLNGSVPTNNQVVTIEDAAFISNRYPVGTTLASSGINDANWTSNDRVYIWNGTEWDTYFHNGTWKKSTDIFGNADTTVIAADSALFITRAAAVTPSNADAGVTQPTPYTLP